jgi:hypothetical protein
VRVNGEIRPAVRTPQKAAAAPSKQAEQMTPVARSLNIDGGASRPKSDPVNQVFAPTPLLAKDPASNVIVKVKTEPQEANARPSEPSYFSCEDMSLDEQLEPTELVETLQHELIVLDETLQPLSDHLQIVPYGTVFADGSSQTERTSPVAAGEHFAHFLFGCSLLLSTLAQTAGERQSLNVPALWSW